MESPEDQIPELAVESETIRRNSNTLTDVKPFQPPAEISMETSNITGAEISKTPLEMHIGVKNESSIKRVDSDSKFGAMETISLELSGQETVSGSTTPNFIPEKSESLKLQMRSLSMNDSNMPSESQEFAFHKRPHSATECETNTLSKYFNINPVQNDKVDSEGVEFFNALAESTQELPYVNNTSSEPATMINKNADDRNKKTEVAEEVLEDSALASETVSQPPVLLKFFAEDKSGNDRDGKAFFDKIAEEKVPGALVTLDINEQILTSDPENQFLTSSMLNGEIEEAWIPSERTRQTLVSIITTNSFSPDKSQLTMPGVIIDDEMKDPVKSLLVECNSSQAQQRKVLTANDVSEDELGLQKLMEADCYHAAINLTKRLLKSCGQGPGEDGKPSKHTPLSLRLWYTRLALLVKLRKFSLAEVESAAFGDLDRPDLYYEFYPDIYKGKRGTMVPFSFRLLLAELPEYQGNHQIALDNMYRLLNTIQKMLKNVQNNCAEDGSMIELSESRRAASLDIWHKRERRVLYSILNCVLSQKDYLLAVSIIKILMEKTGEDAPELHSALGRIYLQLGDVKYAQEYFSKAAALSQLKSEKLDAEENINKALLAIAHNNSEEAYKYYQQAYTLCPENAMLANNMAVCLLYMGRLKESLQLLEKTIQSNPSASLHDGILFNICTLYELESSRCTQKKLAMLELISKYAGDSFNVSCLKIQPVTKA